MLEIGLKYPVSILVRLGTFLLCDFILKFQRERFDSEEAIKIGAQFAQAAQDVGFVSIRNHGVDRELIDMMEQGTLSSFYICSIEVTAES